VPKLKPGISGQGLATEAELVSGLESEEVKE
jgi:hypothetical protein